MTRAQKAREALKRLRACPKEEREQVYREWMQHATFAEVRKYYEHWMGAFPFTTEEEKKGEQT